MENPAITKGKILNLSSNTDVYERGERYYREGKLLSYTTQTGPAGGSVVRSGVEGNYKNYEVTLRLDSRGALEGYTCSCESHSIWRGACKHVVAVLFARIEGVPKAANTDAIRKYGANVTEVLTQLIFDGIDAALDLPQGYSEVQVRLVPVMHLEKRGLYFTMLVGTSRMYMVKNIAHFVESCTREEVVSYGAGLEFEHRRSHFDPAGQKLADYVIAEEALINEVGKQMSRHFIPTRKIGQAAREVLLNGRNIDSFFDLYAGDTLAGEGEFRSEIRFITGKPPLSISITHCSEGTILKAEYPAYHALSGRKFHYLCTEAGILRLNVADGALVLRLLHTLKDAPQGEILFSDSEEQRFLSIILPKLTEMRLVTSTVGEPPARQATPLETKVYLEESGKDIKAKLEFWYGGTVIKKINWDGKTNELSLPLMRDYITEYKIKRMMVASGFNESMYTDGLEYGMCGDEAIYDFLFNTNGALEALRKHAHVYVSEELNGKARRAAVKARMGVRLHGGLLEVTLDDTDFSVAELVDALESYRTRKKFYRLKDGRFIALEDESLTAPLQLLSAMNVSRRDINEKSFMLPSYRALYINELAKESKFSGIFTPDAPFTKLIDDFTNQTNLNFRVPHGLNRILRAYQKTGYFWLKTLAHYGFGGILADDMGLGKTLQIIALLESGRKTRTHPSLIVVPTSLLYNWENEFTRFTPKLKVQVVSGLPERRRELLYNTGADVYITTYDMLKRDAAFYAPFPFEYIVADEAQNIKNPATQAAKSIKSLQSRIRFALTGTPIENNLTELWSIFDFIMPDYLHSARRFARLYEVPIVRDGNNDSAAALRAQIAPFVLRRIKENVLKELPDKTETTLPAEMNPEQKRIYQAYLLEAIGALDDIIARDAFNTSRISILAQLTRLRQICCHPALFIENYDGGSGKFELALETIQIAWESGHRVLLFSQFTSMLAHFRTALDKEPNLSYFYLDGATPATDRMDMSARFNAGDREVFLISLKAGGTGLNLTGADVVIHYDPWWNPSVMDQASDRAHRFGQKKAVQVFNIVAKDSIEEKIMALQDKKRDLIDSVITEGGSFINTLSMDEVRKLFVE